MRYIKSLCLRSELNRDSKDLQTPILSLRRAKALSPSGEQAKESNIKYISVLKRDFENRFDQYVETLPKSNNERKLYTSQAVIKELTEGLKWVPYHTNKGTAYKIEQEKFNKWKESQMNNNSEEMEDIETETEASEASEDDINYLQSYALRD